MTRRMQIDLSAIELAVDDGYRRLDDVGFYRGRPPADCYEGHSQPLRELPGERARYRPLPEYLFRRCHDRFRCGGAERRARGLLALLDLLEPDAIAGHYGKWRALKLRPGQAQEVLDAVGPHVADITRAARTLDCRRNPEADGLPAKPSLAMRQLLAYCEQIASSATPSGRRAQ